MTRFEVISTRFRLGGKKRTFAGYVIISEDNLYLIARLDSAQHIATNWKNIVGPGSKLFLDPAAAQFEIDLGELRKKVYEDMHWPVPLILGKALVIPRELVTEVCYKFLTGLTFHAREMPVTVPLPSKRRAKVMRQLVAYDYAVEGKDAKIHESAKAKTGELRRFNPTEDLDLI